MKKILFGITSLGLGGAERVLVDLVNELSKRHDITIYTIYGKGELLKELYPQIKVKSLYEKPYEEYLGKERRKISNQLFLNKNKVYLDHIGQEEYDIEIAFLEGPITRLFSVRNKKVRKIAWVHTDLYNFYDKSIKSKIKKYLDKKSYNKYETIVFVSTDAKKQFEKAYKDLRDKMLQPVNKRVIYNYISKEKVVEKANEEMDISFDSKRMNLLTVARLVPPKGLERLIKIHARLKKEGFDHNIYIIGEGPLKKYLEELIKHEKVEDTFHLLGAKSNPYPYIKKADMILLPSYFEGYGMILEEAKILNKPILITNTGAREALKGYSKGSIVENNEKAIYEGLKAIIQKGNIEEHGTQEKKEEYPYNNKEIVEKIEKLIGE